ncbi:MAG: hypothetical protein BRD41_06785 [Bacteroidetes bacterium QS_1_63_11]|nr:MAG: hypothetical protein BRD41_06785 [Bacteroidetes bacterium QS_1_63_11]
MTAASDEMNALMKGHYTDDVDTPSAYPLSGVGGANVGPGLSAVEARAVRDLEALEAQLGNDSGMIETLRAAVVESERWRKWLRPEEQGHAFENLSSTRAAATCGPTQTFRKRALASTSTSLPTATPRRTSCGA